MESSAISMTGSSMSDMSSMSMTMSMSGSPTTTMSGISMGSSTDGSMPMPDMLMGMDSMAMVFFTSTNTPLYSWAWTPTTMGQYAGTCIFLIAFAAIFRALLAIRGRSQSFLAMVKQRRNNGTGYVVPRDVKAIPKPWRAGEAVILATMDVVLAGVSYLLMLAVMTMNTGYFLSVLAGVFVGSVAFGHLTVDSTAH